MSTMAKTTLLHESFPSRKKSRDHIMEMISSTLKNLQAPTLRSQEEILLAVDEAITNAMEHGNKWDPHKSIHVSITENSQSINISITDEGRGFSPPVFKGNPKKDNDLTLRGHGLSLINQFCEPTWNNEGNSINLKFMLKFSS